MCNNTTSSNCTVEALQGGGYSLVFLLGFLVNAAALRAFLAKRDSWTDTHIYMLNLVIADSSLVISLPFRIYDAFFCLPNTHLCTVLLFIHFTNMYASIGTTTAISVQRYLAVRFPVHSRSWKKKKETAFAVCLILWALLVAACVVFRKENSPERLWTCYDRCKDKPLSLKLIMLLVVLGFFAPLSVVVFCSSQIICILRKVENKTDEKRNILNIVTVNMVVFIVCYTPIHVAFLWNYYTKIPDNWMFDNLPAHNFLLASEWIASTNCCLDSISYYFLLKGFYSATQSCHSKRLQ